MAIIYTYPSGAVKADDLIVVSETSQVGSPTKNITVSDLANFIITTGEGTGTTDYIVKWTDGPNGIIGDSPAFTFDGGAGLKQLILTDGYRYVVDRDALTTVGDPEYAITQNGVNKTSFGWDDDGGGFGFLYNWAGKGFKFGSTVLYPQLELLTDPDVKTISFSDFEFEADILDINGNVGNAGDVLSSLGAGSGVEWIAAGGVIPWPYNYDAGLFNLMQGTAQAPTNSNNTSLGVVALDSITTGEHNTVMGRGAGNAIQGGSFNVFMGVGAGEDVIGGNNNVAVGDRALQNDNCSDTVAIGTQALQNQNVNASSHNVAVGTQAGRNVDTGTNNTIIGGLAGDALETGANNVIVGYDAADVLLDGKQNTLLGDQVSGALTSGSENIYIGRRAASTATTGDNNIVLGVGATLSAATASNEIIIGNVNNTVLTMPGIQAGATDGDVLTYKAATNALVLNNARGRTIINGLVNNLASAGSGGYDYMEWVSNITSATQIPVMKIPRAMTLRSVAYSWMGDTALSIGAGEFVTFTIGTIPSGSNPVIANYTSALQIFELDALDNGTYANGVVSGLSQLFNVGDVIAVVGQETGTVTPNTGELAITFEFEIN